MYINIYCILVYIVLYFEYNWALVLFLLWKQIFLMIVYETISYIMYLCMITKGFKCVENSLYQLSLIVYYRNEMHSIELNNKK